VSTHRAARSSRPSKPVSPAARARGGRRRATRPARRQPAPSALATVGGVALLVAAAGAANAGQSVPEAGVAYGSEQTSHGTDLGGLSSNAVNGRETTQVSRSGSRDLPANDRQESAANGRADQSAGRRVTPATRLVNAAEKRAAERQDVLRATADDADVYAEELQSNQWIAPTATFDYSTPFGVAGPYWASGYHTGADLSAPSGQPVVAPANGVISSAGYDGAYGNQVRLRLDNGDEIWLNHMSALSVSTGQSVVRGQQVGNVGATGNVSSPTAYHIHLEYRLASDLGTGVDPIPYFAEHGVNL
jgi:murein DD-endopeptidase MepM/ murein hydrolase activator NlpD